MVCVGGLVPTCPGSGSNHWIRCQRETGKPRGACAERMGSEGEGGEGRRGIWGSDMCRGQVYREKFGVLGHLQLPGRKARRRGRGSQCPPPALPYPHRRHWGHRLVRQFCRPCQEDAFKQIQVEWQEGGRRPVVPSLAVFQRTVQGVANPAHITLTPIKHANDSHSSDVNI